MLLRIPVTILGMALASQVAAETSNCTSITEVPTTLTQEGAYCLAHDSATAISSGAAILVAADNVTIDCNDFVLDGSSAGSKTSATGIAANGRDNIKVRNCEIQGFMQGVSLDGSRHVVEDSRFADNTTIGVAVFGDGGMIRRNAVLDTGGNTHSEQSVGIRASYGTIHVLNNTVGNVTATDGSETSAVGIHAYLNPMASISENRISNVQSDGAAIAYGIYTYDSDRISLRDNIVGGDGYGVGLHCSNSTSVATGNHVLGYQQPLILCTNGGGNSVD